MAYASASEESMLGQLMREYAQQSGWTDVPEIYVNADQSGQVVELRVEPLFKPTKKVTITAEQVNRLRRGEIGPTPILRELLGPNPNDWASGGSPNGLTVMRGGSAEVIDVSQLQAGDAVIQDGSNIVYDQDCPPDQVYLMDGVDVGKKTVVMHPRMRSIYQNLGYGERQYQAGAPPITKQVMDKVRERLMKEPFRPSTLPAPEPELEPDVKPRGRRVRVV